MTWPFLYYKKTFEYKMLKLFICKVIIKLNIFESILFIIPVVRRTNNSTKTTVWEKNTSHLIFN